MSDKKQGRPIGTGKYKDGQVTEGDYSESHPERLLDYMSQGFLDCQIFAAFKISKMTFYRWLNDHEEFSRAHDMGLPMCESWWIEWGQKGMRGEIKGFNFNSWIAFMNNKFKWAKGTYGDNATNVTNNISVGNMNVLQHQGRNDLIQSLIDLSQKHSEIIPIEFINESTEDQSSEPESD